MNALAKSLLEMANGAFLERTDYEMARVIDNILDPNTKATAKRKITLTVELAPDDTRTKIATNVTVKTSLATTVPIMTSLYVAGENGTGEMQVVEMTPQVPGQMSVDGTEQSAPPTLKLYKIS